MPTDPKEVDQDGSMGDMEASNPAQRQGGKSEALLEKGDAREFGSQESAGELEGYVTQLAAIRLFSTDPKVSKLPCMLGTWLGCFS